MKEKKRINMASAKENGIFFFSNLNPDLVVETSIDDSGNINTRIIPAFIKDCADFNNIGAIVDDTVKSYKKKLIILVSTIMILSIISGKPSFILAGAYFNFFVSTYLITFIDVALKMKRGTMKSHARYHAAEHMATNAYEKLQRIPTLDEIKQFSRFSKSCGSRIILEKILLYTFISVEIAFLSGNMIIYCIVLPVSIIFVIIGTKLGWFKFFQIFITTEPTDIELNVAIEGLKAFEELEKLIEERENLRKKVSEMDLQL